MIRTLIYRILLLIYIHVSNTKEQPFSRHVWQTFLYSFHCGDCRTSAACKDTTQLSRGDMYKISKLLLCHLLTFHYFSYTIFHNLTVLEPL